MLVDGSHVIDRVVKDFVGMSDARSEVPEPVWYEALSETFIRRVLGDYLFLPILVRSAQRGSMPEETLRIFGEHQSDRDALARRMDQLYQSFQPCENDGSFSMYLFDCIWESAPGSPMRTVLKNPTVVDLALRRSFETRRQLYAYLGRMESDIGIEESEQVRPVFGRERSMLSVPDKPGIYLGYLTGDCETDRKVQQKTVDTMIAVCGAIKAQGGRNIALYSADADFIPMANYVLSLGRAFTLFHMSQISKKWDHLRGMARFRTVDVSDDAHNRWGVSRHRRGS